MLHLNHTLGREIHDVLQFVRKDIARAVPDLLSEIQDAVDTSLKDNFGENLPGPRSQFQWRQVQLLPAAVGVISQITCRILVGKKLSQNKAFTSQAVTLTHWLIFITLVLDWVPSSARGIAMWLLPFNRRKRDFKEMLRDSILKCQSDIINEKREKATQLVCSSCSANYRKVR